MTRASHVLADVGVRRRTLRRRLVALGAVTLGTAVLLACNAILGIEDLSARPGSIALDGLGDGGTLTFSAFCGASASTQAVALTNRGTSRIAWSAELALGERSPFVLDAMRGELDVSASTAITISAKPIAPDASTDPNGATDESGSNDTLTIHRLPDPDVVVQLRRTAQGAALAVSLMSLDLGDQPYGAPSAGFPVSITNQGNAAATFTVATVAPWSASPSGEKTLAPGETFLTYVAVTLGAPGAYPGALDLRVSDRTVVCGAVTGIPLLANGVNGVVELGGGTRHVCVRRSDGTVACWGNNAKGQLGRDAGIDSYGDPRDVAGLRGATGLGLGYRHSCATFAATADADAGSVACWGENSWIQTGDPPRVTSGPGFPAEMQRRAFQSSATTVDTSGVSAVQVASSQLASCLRSPDGRVLCWGSTDDHGSVFGVPPNTPIIDGGLLFGNSGPAFTSRATQVPLTPPTLTGVTDLVMGTMVRSASPQTCAQTGAGVVCWPRLVVGDAGLDVATYGTFPVVTPGGGAIRSKKLVGGQNALYALQDDGTVLAWGDNDTGRLGDGTTTSPPSDPQTTTTVRDLNDAIAVGAGVDHACAVRKSGAVVCWGKNALGQLGDGTTTDSLVPVAVKGLPGPATALTSSSFGVCNFTCALLAGGSVYCWGVNNFAQLGQGDAAVAQSPVPVRVIGLGDVNGTTPL
jgi:alpha-tubulin suppressor-like RCC1 family protein